MAGPGRSCRSRCRPLPRPRALDDHVALDEQEAVLDLLGERASKLDLGARPPDPAVLQQGRRAVELRCRHRPPSAMRYGRAESCHGPGAVPAVGGPAPRRRGCPCARRAERLADRGPGLGRPAGLGEHGGQLEQGVAVLVEEVGPGRQRDRRPGQLLGLGELPAGGQDPGQEALPDHLGQEGPRPRRRPGSPR